MGYHLMPGLGMERREDKPGISLPLSPRSGLNLLNPQKPQGSLLVKIEHARGLEVLWN